MSIVTKGFVDTFAKSGFLALDFNTFAIVVELGWDQAVRNFRDDFYYCPGRKYLKNLYGHWGKKMDLEILQNKEISQSSFMAIKKAFSKWYYERPARLWTLLRINFPQQVRIYGK